MLIIRPKFDVRICSPADLDALAELWLKLFDLSANTQNLSAEHHLTIQLHSIARHQQGEIQRELEDCLHSHGFEALENSPAETCSVTREPEAMNVRPLHGLGILQLAESLNSYPLEIRLTVRGYLHNRLELESTLVMVGEQKEGSLHLRAIWRSGAVPDWENPLYRGSQWPLESAFWQAWEDLQNQDLRESPEVVKLANAIFANRQADRLGYRTHRALFAPINGQSRVPGLLVRFVGFSIIPALLIGNFSGLPANSVQVILFEVFIVLMASIPLLFWLYCEFSIFRAIGKTIRVQTRALYAGDFRFLSAPETLVAEIFQRAEPRRVDAELRNLGFQLTGHIRQESALQSVALISAYHRPRNPQMNVLCYFTLEEAPVEGVPSLQYWPAMVMLQAHARFGDGFVSVFDNLAYGWRRKITGDSCVTRFRTERPGLTELLTIHKQECERYETHTGQLPVACHSLPALLAWLNEWKRLEIEAFRNKPFSLGDWIHIWLQRVRGVYRR